MMLMLDKFKFSVIITLQKVAWRSLLAPLIHERQHTLRRIADRDKLAERNHFSVSGDIHHLNYRLLFCL